MNLFKDEKALFVLSVIIIVALCFYFVEENTIIVSPLAVPHPTPNLQDSNVYLPTIRMIKGTTFISPLAPPNLSIYTETTVLVWPITNTVNVGQLVTKTVFIANRNNIYVLEIALVQNPIVLEIITATLASGSTCPIYGVHLRGSPIVQIECEGLILNEDGRLFNVVYRAKRAGLSYIDNRGFFAGLESGWGFYPDGNRGIVFVR